VTLHFRIALPINYGGCLPCISTSLPDATRDARPLPEPAASARSETLWLRVRRSLIAASLGRRMLGQYVGAAMLPIGALAVLDYLHAGNTTSSRSRRWPPRS